MAEPSKPAGNGGNGPKRGAGGRFAPGGGGGPGRRTAGAEAAYLAAARRAVPEERWEAAVRSALEKAESEGDAHALVALAKLLPGATAPTKAEVETTVRPALPDLSRPGVVDDLDALLERAFARAPISVEVAPLELPGPSSSS